LDKTSKIASIITELNSNKQELESIQSELDKHTTKNTNQTNNTSKIASIISELKKKLEDCGKEKSKDKNDFTNRLKDLIRLNELDIKNKDKTISEKQNELDTLKLRLSEFAHGGIDSKIVHLNNLFSKTEDYKARLEIDSSKFREQFNSNDKRTTYLNTLYKWSSLKMLNTIETTTTSSVYEKYIDVVKYSSEDFVNALFLFTIAFQVGLNENVLY
jgi:DNA repair exonuclease SbcCD ATPase subunit